MLYYADAAGAKALMMMILLMMISFNAFSITAIISAARLNMGISLLLALRALYAPARACYILCHEEMRKTSASTRVRLTRLPHFMAVPALACYGRYDRIKRRRGDL